MSQLGPGLYSIINAAFNESIGISFTGTNPAKQPVTPDFRPQPWFIAQPGNGGSILSIDGYVTISEDNGVWAVVGTASATEWAVRPYEHAFIIADPKPGDNVWTLWDQNPNTQVSLENLFTEDGHVNPAQLWYIELD